MAATLQTRDRFAAASAWRCAGSQQRAFSMRGHSSPSNVRVQWMPRDRRLRSQSESDRAYATTRRLCCSHQCHRNNSAMCRWDDPAGEPAVGEPSLPIDVVELGCLEQRIDGGDALAAGIGASAALVVAADGDATPTRRRRWSCSRPSRGDESARPRR